MPTNLRDKEDNEMRLVSFRKSEQASYGCLLEDGILDLGKRFGDRYGDLKSILRADALSEIADWASGRRADLAEDDVDFLPVIPNPEKIVCIGLNYEMHCKETQRDTTEQPVLFLRIPLSQIGHSQAILLPPESSHLDYEGKLAVVIGKAGRRVSREDAFDHIAGYACYNDATIRDWQFHTHQYTPGKNFPATGAFGPALVTKDEIEDVATLSLVTRLNGEEVQRAKIDQMIFDIAEQIEYISKFTALEPGDVLVTGTPGGVGMKRTPPLWMKAGDRVEVEISGVGLLSNPIAAE